MTEKFPESGSLKAPLWLLEESQYADVVICARVSQMRNIADMPFCTSLEDEPRHEIHEIILKRFAHALPNRLNMSELDPLERYRLFERLTIPFRIAATPKRSILLFNASESEILIACGLEHVFMSFSSILENTDVIFKSSNSAIEALRENFKWAVHPQYGYLSSNPANCGAGVVFSIICHIPAIILQNQMHQIRNLANENNMYIQDPWSGDFEGRGSYIKFVSRTLVGKNPMELLAKALKTAEGVIALEREMRTLLHERSAKIIADAQHDAERIRNEAEDYATNMINDMQARIDTQRNQLYELVGIYESYKRQLLQSLEGFLYAIREFESSTESQEAQNALAKLGQRMGAPSVLDPFSVISKTVHRRKRRAFFSRKNR